MALDPSRLSFHFVLLGIFDFLSDSVLGHWDLNIELGRPKAKDDVAGALPLIIELAQKPLCMILNHLIDWGW